MKYLLSIKKEYDGKEYVFVFDTRNDRTEAIHLLENFGTYYDIWLTSG